MPITLSDISIRTHLQPGDIGLLINLHDTMYAQEYGYGINFEAYVAHTLYDFYQNYNEKTNRVWVCEHAGKMIGFLPLKDRGEAAQLRYFLIAPGYRGIGLARKLLNLYMDFMRACGYKKSYLLTTPELIQAAALYKSYGYVLTEESESWDFGKQVRVQRYDLVLEQ